MAAEVVTQIISISQVEPVAERPFTKIVAAESFRRVVSYTVKSKVRDTQATTREGFVINLRWD